MFMKKIAAFRIIKAMKVEPIHEFIANEDENNFYDIHAARDDAFILYHAVTRPNGTHYLSPYYQDDLIDIDRPVPEGDAYIVCVHPSELTQKAIKFAKAGCDWNVETNEPCLGSAIDRVKSDSFDCAMNTFATLCDLFPEKVDLLREERYDFIMDRTQGLVKLLAYTAEIRKDIEDRLSILEAEYPDKKDEIEEIRCDYFLNLVSGEHTSDGLVFTKAYNDFASLLK